MGWQAHGMTFSLWFAMFADPGKVVHDCPGAANCKLRPAFREHLSDRFGVALTPVVLADADQAPVLLVPQVCALI